MARKYLFVPMTEGSLNLRGHYRETMPPTLVGGKNLYYSSSDLAPTVRPDIEATSESHVGIADGIGGTDHDKQDYINSAHGVFGTDKVVFVSKTGAYTTDTDTGFVILSNSYSEPDATVTISSGENILVGTGTLWNQNLWPGCLIFLGESQVPYRVISVTDDTHCILHKTVTSDFSSSTYTSLRSHSFEHADYKANMAAFTNNLIFATPNISLPIAEEEISGPFYTSIERTDDQVIGEWTWETVADVNAPPILFNQQWYGNRGGCFPAPKQC